MPNATAILIFAQPVVYDAARKRIAHQSLSNRRVLEQLNEHTRLIAEATTLPVVHSSSLIAHTGSFGSQFTRACRATFALGFDRILVIGNDCPALTTAHLTGAANQLETASVIVGPDRRGGVYLLGLSRGAFEQVSPSALPWQTVHLAQAVRQLYADQPILSLPQLGDLNSRVDLQQYADLTPTVTLLLASLLSLGSVRGSCTDYPPFARAHCTYLIGSRSLRAPPTLRTR